MLKNYVVIDLEMTGLSPVKDKILEVAGVKIVDGKVTETYSKLINPNIFIREKIVNITGITEEMVKNSPNIEDILQEFMQFIDGNILVGHNIIFDFSFVKQALFDMKLNKYLNEKWYGIDTLKIARKNILPEQSKKLDDLCLFYGIKDESHHRALNDAIVTNELYKKLCIDYESDNNTFQIEELIYKPEKEKMATKKQIAYANKLLSYHNIVCKYNLEQMTQGELSRYVDKVILQYGRM